MSSRRGWGGGGAYGGILIDRFGPGVGHLNYLAVPGVGIFEFIVAVVCGSKLTNYETTRFPGRSAGKRSHLKGLYLLFIQKTA